MKLNELFKGLTIEKAFEGEAKGISCDSRRVTEGYVFVCVKGFKQDGHRYAQSAYQKGAMLILTEEDLGLDNQIIIPSSREAWAVLSANWFGNPAKKLKLIGITGTNGKTTVSYFIKNLLESLNYKVGLIGTIQNIVAGEATKATHTTPDAFELNEILSLMEKAKCDYVVMEVSSHALEQGRVFGLEFEVGVFTNFTQDHLDYHLTMENYFNAKMKLFENSKDAVFNADDEWVCKGIPFVKGECITFSAKGKESDFTAKDIELKGSGVSYNILGREEKGRIKVPVPGGFSVYNSLAAIAVVTALGVSYSDVYPALGSLKGVPGRVEVVHRPRKNSVLDFTVIIDFAHTPDALEKICETIRASTKGRLVTLFGSPGERDRGKRPIMAKVVAKYSDFIIVTSDNPASEEPEDIAKEIVAGLEEISFEKEKYQVIIDREEAILWAIKNARQGDVILLAGKGHESYQIMKEGPVDFNEREVVRKALISLGGDN